jgi:hypothetical protein
VELLTPTRLNQVVTEIFERVAIRYPFSFPQFELMFWQGCRFCDTHKFQIVSSTEEATIYTPCKNQVNAITVSPEAAEVFFRLYSYGFQEVRKYSYSAMQEQFNKQSYGLHMKLADKSADLHVFRYNRIRQLFAEGKTKEEIKSLYAFSSIGLVNSYLNTDIWLID